MNSERVLHFAWINLFIRDFLIALVIFLINYLLEFNSWFAAFLFGAVFVWITYHLEEFIEYKKRSYLP